MGEWEGNDRGMGIENPGTERPPPPSQHLPKYVAEKYVAGESPHLVTRDVLIELATSPSKVMEPVQGKRRSWLGARLGVLAAHLAGGICDENWLKDVDKRLQRLRLWGFIRRFKQDRHGLWLEPEELGLASGFEFAPEPSIAGLQSYYVYCVTPHGFAKATKWSGRSLHPLSETMGGWDDDEAE